MLDEKYIEILLSMAEEANKNDYSLEFFAKIVKAAATPHVYLHLFPYKHLFPDTNNDQLDREDKEHIITEIIHTIIPDPETFVELVSAASSRNVKCADCYY